MCEYPKSLEKVPNLRFDRHGEIYPEINVDSRIMLKLNNLAESNFESTSRNLYELNDSLRIILQQKYNITKANSTFEEFHKIVVDDKIKQLNQAFLDGNYTSITFIMVGFNNYYLSGPIPDDNANYKLDQLKGKINAYTLAKNKPTTMVVKVFWDGTVAENKIYAAFNFSYSSVNSFWAGIGLREIINGLNCQKLNFISHSMGANVVTEALIDQVSKIGNQSKLFSELSPYRKKIPIPNNDKIIKAALIAPAIPGHTTFIDYKPINNNWKFIIGYNTNDLILKKELASFLKLTSHFSSTTLGCDSNEVKLVIDYISNKNLLIPINFSNNKNNPFYDHDLIKYMGLQQYDLVLDELFK